MRNEILNRDYVVRNNELLSSNTPLVRLILLARKDSELRDIINSVMYRTYRENNVNEIDYLSYYDSYVEEL